MDQTLTQILQALIVAHREIDDLRADLAERRALSPVDTRLLQHDAVNNPQHEQSQPQSRGE